MKKIIILAWIMGLILSMSGCGNTSQGSTISTTDEKKDVITVTSSEDVKAVPDVADIIYGIRTESEDAVSCQNKNSEDISHIVEVLKGFDIDEKSIQTNSYGLTPKYNWGSDQQSIIGYEMQTNLTISGLSIDQVSTVVSESVNAGINTIEKISYKTSNYDECYQKALKLAVESAQKKAKALADVSNCTLGDIAYLEELSSEQENKYTNYNANEMTMDSTTSDKAMIVMPGETSIQASVSVDFYIR